MPRPHVLLSAAVSIDGYLDTRPGEDRLLLSNDADFDRVDAVRASCDAILVGSNTLRLDNPRLLVKSEQRRADRKAAGLPEYPLKVTVTASGDLDPEWKFWHYGGRKIAYAAGQEAADKARGLLGDLADVYAMPPVKSWEMLLEHLYTVHGVRRLMVEGGGQVHTQLLQQGLADELHLVVAPLLVGQADAPRMLGDGPYPGGPLRRMHLLESRQIGDVILLRYAPKKTSDAQVAA
ncbi:dihydrofolate reductase family protein [Streptomyces sp. ML-6]|uniref:RibD family protein n=1 Tax=Streptomyces sp. ML-6 TaxID=2982693 RepID=UPI0032E05311